MNDEIQTPSLKITLKRRDGSIALDLELPRDGKPRVLGRDALCDFCLDSPALAPRHAEFSLTPKGLLVRDLGSVNGVQVDGRRLDRREAHLRAGRQVVMGEFSFTVPAHSGAGTVSAPGARNKRLMLILLVLCVATLAAWILKQKQPQATDTAPQAGPGPALNVESNAALSGHGREPPQDGRLDAFRRAAQLMQQGQYLLYASNDYLAAAALLNESLALDPRNTQALGILRTIQYAHMQEALTEGMESIESGDMARAGRILERMKMMSPADGRVLEFESYLRGEESCEQAAALLRQARYADVISVLENAKVLNEYKRQELINQAGFQLELAAQFKQIDDRLNAWQIPEAQALCAGMEARSGLLVSQKADLALRRQLAARAAELDAFLAQSNDVAAIESADALLDSPRFQKYQGARTIALARMDALRKRIGPDRDGYERDARNAMADAAAAEARGGHYEAARLNSRALKSLIIAGFITPLPGNQAEIDRLRTDISGFAGKTFNRAYVLESRGAGREAAELYLQILDVAPQADPDAVKARKRLADLRALIPAEQGARGLIDGRLRNGASVLPVQADREPAGDAPGNQAPQANQPAPRPASAPAAGRPGAGGSGNLPIKGEEVIPPSEKPFSSK